MVVADDLVDLILRQGLLTDQDRTQRLAGLLLAAERVPQRLRVDQAALKQSLAQAPRLFTVADQAADVAVVEVEVVLFERVAHPQHTLHLGHRQRLKDVR